MDDHISTQFTGSLKPFLILKPERSYRASFPGVRWRWFESGMSFTKVNCWKTGNLLGSTTP